MESLESFRRFGIITIVAVFVLILVGSVVRTTGAGMGCPDWPKCFGYWVPPTDITQLPPDYKEVFKVAGKPIADFDAFKTWTEYVNRLVGVVIGLFIFITMLLSFRFRKTDSWITILSIVSFVLVGFEGWLGSIVVSTNLKPITITLHMIVALLLVALLIYTIARAYRDVLVIEKISFPHTINTVVIVSLLLSLIQIAIGTQVRESIDHIAFQLGEPQRHTWIEHLSVSFYVHRSFSLLLMGVNLYLIKLIFDATSKGGRLRKWGIVVGVLIGIEILSGVGLAYLGMPKALQPVHLFVASLLFGAQFMVWLIVNYERLFGKGNTPSSKPLSQNIWS